MEDIKTYEVARLKEFTTRVFKHFNVPEDDAELAADVLSTADVRGIDSHGVARLHSYFELLSIGEINPTAKVRIVREMPATATVDGDNGLGLVVGPKANAIAMEKAETVGSAWVSVCNSNHYGIAGYYSLKALERDMIGWAMTSSSKLVAPLWGAERMLGTNAISVAFPGKHEPPVVIDMATSTVAYGKIEMARRKKEKIPHGWAVNHRGESTTEPMEMIEGGAMLPLGSERDLGGHKGYALAAMVDILSSVLSGANWGPFAPPFALRQEIPERSVGKGLGHIFGAMKIEAFIDTEEFKSQIDDWIRTFRNTKPASGTNGPLIPGDPERWATEERLRAGVPLISAVREELMDISKKTGIPFE
jgi:L-2-hydroxycarboxylate dehydrogenase (NAD+)